MGGFAKYLGLETKTVKDYMGIYRKGFWKQFGYIYTKRYGSRVCRLQTRSSDTRVTMLRYILLSCFLGIALSAKKDYKICYKGQDESGNTCMNVEADAKAGTIYYHVLESPDYEDVETLEDYNVGLAASRVATQEACYVSRLMRPFNKQEAYLKAHDQETDMRPETDIKVTAIPMENPEEEMGSSLTSFCGEFNIYKLVKTQEEEQNHDESEDVEKRQITLTFTRCVMLRCYYIPVCYTTTITLPTGTTIIFGWYWFG
ncbi:hypothetical protein SK128_023211 [Halocaridina rubra]|uniref:BRICHOS domain-containing protein n=1 Tax=Halocaridina rubra TaxID=373956 RepID=A0AAN8WLE4_HALRR